MHSPTNRAPINRCWSFRNNWGGGTYVIDCPLVLHKLGCFRCTFPRGRSSHWGWASPPASPRSLHDWASYYFPNRWRNEESGRARYSFGSWFSLGSKAIAFCNKCGTDVNIITSTYLIFAHRKRRGRTWGRHSYSLAFSTNQTEKRKLYNTNINKAKQRSSVLFSLGFESN